MEAVGRRVGRRVRAGKAAAVIALLAASASASSAHAIATAAARNPPPAAPRLRGAPHAAAVWTVDKAASHVGFRALLAGRPVDGVFKRWDVQLAFDPANLRASRLVAVVQAASAVTGQPGRDQALPGPDWLSAARFPHAVFTSRSITAAGPGSYLAIGDLSVRGVTRPATVPLAVQLVHDKMRLDASFQLDRGAYGVGQGSWLSGDTLALPVQITVRLSAARAK